MQKLKQIYWNGRWKFTFFNFKLFTQHNILHFNKNTSIVHCTPLFIFWQDPAESILLYICYNSTTVLNSNNLFILCILFAQHPITTILCIQTNPQLKDFKRLLFDLVQKHFCKRLIFLPCCNAVWVFVYKSVYLFTFTHIYQIYKVYCLTYNVN